MKISQAMIVKNEEKNIERALSWGKAVVSEQIVVDTGSTDRTVEIAKKMGAEVYFFPWQDDFSLAKNFAISKCRYPWIAMLDADEYFSEQDAKKMKDYIALVEKDPKVHGLRTAIADIDPNGQVVSLDSTVRLFRNREDIRYRRAIHEQLCLTNGEDFRPANCGNNLTVLHTGYQAEVLSKKLKENRNKNLLLKELEKNPEEFDLYVYLGMEYAFRKKWKEAILQYKKFYAFFPEKQEKYKAVFSMALSAHLRALYQLSEEERTEGQTAGQEVLDTERQALLCDAEELLKKGREFLPESTDYLYQIAMLYYRNGFYENVLSLLLEFLEKKEKEKNTVFSKEALSEMLSVYGMLADSYFRLGKYREAVQYATAVLQSDPKQVDVLQILLFTFSRAGTPWREVEQFLSPIYGDAMDSVRSLAVKAGYSMAEKDAL
ncbi:MAG: glycosyltransferase [Lachnospiraceae bacterium]|nr:glycosyltransferase [Lachnospiraceae bacterium]